MSTETESNSPSEHSSTTFTTDNKIVKEVILWRNKKLSFSILLGATATWVVLEIYRFNFLTVASWFAMAVVALLFLFGNLCRVLGREPPNFPGTEISQESALNAAMTLKMWIEEGLRWSLRMGAESEWYQFAGVVAALWAISVVCSCFDFTTILYMGVVVGLTVPVVYVKYEDKIRSFGNGIRTRGRRLYEKLDEKVLRKVKNKLVGDVHDKKKDKQVE